MASVERYTAAGGVVVRDGCVLVLRRPRRGEVRLPKGHVEPEETLQDAALRETCEESGYASLVLLNDLGEQIVEFEYGGKHFVRTEHYYVMTLDEEDAMISDGESQFEPEWLTWDEALAELTYEAEREWVRRARQVLRSEEKR
jgi:8-oxo-dGTP pyrophosphatase MutT (NUDIX family)